jgi:hypothetical protein
MICVNGIQIDITMTDAKSSLEQKKSEQCEGFLIKLLLVHCLSIIMTPIQKLAIKIVAFFCSTVCVTIHCASASAVLRGAESHSKSTYQGLYGDPNSKSAYQGLYGVIQQKSFEAHGSFFSFDPTNGAQLVEIAECVDELRDAFVPYKLAQNWLLGWAAGLFQSNRFANVGIDQCSGTAVAVDCHPDDHAFKCLAQGMYNTIHTRILRVTAIRTFSWYDGIIAAGLGEVAAHADEGFGAHVSAHVRREKLRKLAACFLAVGVRESLEAISSNKQDGCQRHAGQGKEGNAQKAIGSEKFERHGTFFGNTSCAKHGENDQQDSFLLAVDSKSDGPASTCEVEGIGEMIQTCHLQMHTIKIFAWCDDMGAIELEEVAEFADELGDALGLQKLEQLRLQNWAATFLGNGMPESPEASSNEQDEVDSTVYSRVRWASPLFDVIEFSAPPDEHFNFRLLIIPSADCLQSDDESDAEENMKENDDNAADAEQAYGIDNSKGFALKRLITRRWRHVVDIADAETDVGSMSGMTSLASTSHDEIRPCHSLAKRW